MDQLEEVSALLAIIERLTAHPAQYGHIRTAAVLRLAEINKELDPNPPAEQKPPEEIGVAEDNPATGEDREEAKDGA